MNIEQQAEYIELLREMHGKVLRVCGEGSRQEKSFLGIIDTQIVILSLMLKADFFGSEGINDV